MCQVSSPLAPTGLRPNPGRSSELAGVLGIDMQEWNGAKHLFERRQLAFKPHEASRAEAEDR